MTFFFRKHFNFVPSASCFLDNSDVESDSEVVQRKRKRKRVVIYSGSDGEDESHEGPRAKIDVKAKNDEIGIIVEKCL